jgi:hypothetical protein
MSSIIIKRATIVINSICGFAITFSECSDDLSYLNRVMLAAGIALDNPQYIIVSYRGTAERAFVDADLSSCFHFFCGLHMVRNLKANRWTDYLPLFWKARNAPTRTEHHQCMDNIKSKCPPMFTYLDNADRWQLYLALESGRMLYDWKSDNMIEMGISDNVLFTEKYFHVHCFTVPLKGMFTKVPSLIGRVPSTSAVEERLHRQTFQTVRPRLIVNTGSSRSSKRIASTGEASGKSTISAGAYSKSRKQCGICLEMFARRTIHTRPRRAKRFVSEKILLFPSAGSVLNWMHRC